MPGDLPQIGLHYLFDWDNCISLLREYYFSNHFVNIGIRELDTYPESAFKLLEVWRSCYGRLPYAYKEELSADVLAAGFNNLSYIIRPLTILIYIHLDLVKDYKS